MYLNLKYHGITNSLPCYLRTQVLILEHFDLVYNASSLIQGSSNLIDFCVYTSDGLASGCHKLVWMAFFTILKEVPQTDCIILPDYSEATIGCLFSLIYGEENWYVTYVKVIVTSLEDNYYTLESL